MQPIGLRARQAGLSKLIILLILLVVILVGSGVTLALYFTGVFDSEPAEQLGPDGEPVVQEEKPSEPPKYMPMEPPLVVNFERQGQLGYLQVNMQLMVRGTEAMHNVLAHMPVIRDSMLMLLSTQTYDDIKTREGKENLRQEALTEVNRVLAEKQVEDKVEAVYFTGFVMQ